ncbi:MAG: AAA family ATPase, partial [Cyanobacteria bacterium P01_H01_bin.121]
MAPLSSVHDLKTLILSFHPAIAIETGEEARVFALLQDATQALNLPLFEWTITRGLLRHPNRQAIAATKEPQQLLDQLYNLNLEGVFILKDFTPHLKDATLIRRLREVLQRFTQNHSTLILTGRSLSLPAALSPEVVHYPLQLPSRDELYAALLTVVRSLQKRQQLQIDLNPDTLNAVLNALQGLTLDQARQIVAYAILLDNKLSVDDVQHILDRKRQFLEQDGLLEYYPPEANQHDLGGFERLQSWLERARAGFTPEAAELNLPAPKGILLVGVQGCGKSLAAKVIARQWQLPLLKLDAGRLYGKYVGESEKNFRRAIALADAMAPAVLWIDELEKSFGGTGDSDSGVSQRLFGSLLTWMQEKDQAIFLVATANDLSKLPPELLRKGRFDEIFFVDLPVAPERETIFKIHLRLRKQDPELFHLAALVTATEGFSGAEIEQAIITALYQALHIIVPLPPELILAEVKATVPLSVSRKEDIEQLQAYARDRFVSV